MLKLKVFFKTGEKSMLNSTGEMRTTTLCCSVCYRCDEAISIDWHNVNKLEKEKINIAENRTLLFFSNALQDSIDLRFFSSLDISRLITSYKRSLHARRHDDEWKLLFVLTAANDDDGWLKARKIVSKISADAGRHVGRTHAYCIYCTLFEDRLFFCVLPFF